MVEKNNFFRKQRDETKKYLLSEVGFEPTPSYEDQNALDYL